MLITCPDCATSYDVDTDSLGPAGRTVRCAQCGAKWKAVPEPTAAEAEVEELDKAEDDAERWEDEPEEVSQPDLPAPAPAVASPRPADRQSEAQRRFARPTTLDRGVIGPLRKPKFTSIAAAAGVVAIVALVGFRDRVVGAVPDLAGLYAAVGLPVNLRGLEFRDLTTTEMMENGIPLLVVTGTIQNISGNRAEVPRVRLAVRGTGGHEIYVWTAMPSRSELAVGEALPFWAQLASPPAEGREVAVRFLSVRDVTPAARKPTS